MKKLTMLFLTLSIVIVSFSQVAVQNLLTENLVNQIGLDEKLPRYSWQLSSDKRNVLQKAYEIKINSGKSPVWSSGKVVAGQSVQVPFGSGAFQPGKK